MLFLIYTDKEQPKIQSDLTFILKEALAGGTTTVVNWQIPVITDNSGPHITIVSSHQPGDLFFVGSTDVTYTATDPSGNKATFTFSIHVIEGNN